MKNVIQLDLSKYIVRLTYDTEGISNDFSADYLSYGFTHWGDGSVTTANTTFTITNDTVTSFSLEPTGGPLFFTSPISNNIGSTKKIMQNYQTWTNDSDVNKMISLLNTAGSERNFTEISDNIDLKILTTSEQTSFNWSYTYNGVDYSSVNLGFQNIYGRPFIIFSDNRGIYQIGNTKINISQQQAIQIAEDYARTITYPLNYGNGTIIIVKDLNVNETNIIANLSTTSKDSATLYPYWNVQIPLDHNYPGKTYAVTVSIWADNGTVFNAQRNVVALSFPVPSLATVSLLAFIPLLAIIFAFLLVIVVVLIYLLGTRNRTDRTVEKIFVLGRNTQEIKDEVLKWFNQNNVEILENHEDSVKGRWGNWTSNSPQILSGFV